MASERLSIRLPRKLQADLSSIVESSGRSESEIVREAIEEYVKKHHRAPTAYDLAEKMGIIGCFDSGHEDLSTNPAHMEGFGRD